MVALTPAIVVLSASGLATARAIEDATGGALHGRAGRVDAAITFENAPEHLRALFAAGRPVIGVCAAGILIRALAPRILDKGAEPPVIAVSEDGVSVVPLLGGHRGANRLSAHIAQALKAHLALTTAGDVSLGLALDEPPAGWRLANPHDAKGFMAAVLSGERVRLPAEPGWLGALPTGEDAALRAITTEHPAQGDARTLVYHPQQYILGAGCARHCPPGELITLVETMLAEAGVAPGAIACVASLDLKADEAAIHSLSGHLGVAARFFDAARLEAEAPRLANPSRTVFAEVGCHGVAEGAALAGAGAAGALVAEKRKSANATCALARAAEPLTDLPGRPQGRVSVVGIGPGRSGWRTPEASRLIAEAEELVGYGLYIDLLGAAAAGKPRKDFPLGGEEARCRHALEEAGKGRNIALVCSGDGGIYAMGALVMELLARAPERGGVSDAARRAEIVHAPGITALQAASARAGAMIGHDFCAISLSDLLTPREDILRRLRAAAEGDFVTAFYNPVSKRRRTLLEEARTILLRHRPAQTPVLLAASLGRPEESLRWRTLDTLAVDEVDMLTVVIVGSSQTEVIDRGDGQRRAFTPRGYARKLEG